MFLSESSPEFLLRFGTKGFCYVNRYNLAQHTRESDIEFNVLFGIEFDIDLEAEFDEG